MKFDINNYKGKYVMHCKTFEEAKEFCNYLHSIERKWSHGVSYKATTCWTRNTKEICYNFNEGVYSDKDYYEKAGYTILEWSDFTTEFTKADLQNGMIVEYACGRKRMVLNGNLLSMTSGHAPFTDFLDDLKCKWDADLNINKVYTCNTDCLTGLPDVFDEHNLTLIWERKEKPEPVEMTIEEICKALGKEIKIVKG